jgi:hypothetical protein
VKHHTTGAGSMPRHIRPDNAAGLLTTKGRHTLLRGGTALQCILLRSMPGLLVQLPEKQAPGPPWYTQSDLSGRLAVRQTPVSGGQITAADLSTGLPAASTSCWQGGALHSGAAQRSAGQQQSRARGV